MERTKPDMNLQFQW